jgi:hypothetical protein
MNDVRYRSDGKLDASHKTKGDRPERQYPRKFKSLQKSQEGQFQRYNDKEV